MQNDDFVFNGQVAYYRNNRVEYEVRLKYPFYQVWSYGELKQSFKVDELSEKKLIYIKEKQPGRFCYYVGYCEEEDEVFILQKCDGEREYTIPKRKRLKEKELPDESNYLLDSLKSGLESNQRSIVGRPSWYRKEVL